MPDRHEGYALDFEALADIEVLRGNACEEEVFDAVTMLRVWLHDRRTFLEDDVPYKGAAACIDDHFRGIPRGSEGWGA